MPLSVILQHPCEHSRINIYQWVLTKFDTVFNIINHHKKTQTPNILGSARQTCRQQFINQIQI
jgi:hypothetical protein